MSHKFCPIPTAPSGIDGEWRCPLCGQRWVAYATTPRHVAQGARPFGWITDGPLKGCVL